jgi:putative phage-type endonuclease
MAIMPTKTRATQTMHPKIEAILARPRIRQHTPEWYTNRACLLTASDAASALGIGFQSRHQVFMKKTGQNKKADVMSVACRYGLEQEDNAARIYTAVTGIALVNDDIGLLRHATMPIFGASPDRLAQQYPIIIEIKSPWRRVIVPGEIPAYYIPQIQMQMEICDLDICHFVQFVPPTASTKGIMDITEIERDREWWAQNVGELEQFWNEVATFYKECGLPMGTKKAPNGSPTHIAATPLPSRCCVVGIDGEAVDGFFAPDAPAPTIDFDPENFVVTMQKKSVCNNNNQQSDTKTSP